MKKPVKVLLITGNESVSAKVIKLLSNSDSPQYTVKTACSLKDAIECILKKGIEIIFFYFSKDEQLEFNTLKTIALGYPRIPILGFFTGMDFGIGIKVLANGAQEIIRYDTMDTETIKMYIEYAIERKKRETSLVQAKKEMEQNSIDLKNGLREIKSLMVEVEKKNKELKELNKLKSNFVSIVSHELRTPLTYIKEGVAQVLEGLHGEINEDQREFLTISIEGMDRLSEIVNNLLDISKIEANKIKLRKDFIDFGEMVKHVILGFKSIYSKKNLALDIVMPNEKIVLFIDSEKIIQVFNNLLSNAYKFTHQGGVKIKIKKKKKEIEVSVEDTGIGMSKQNIDKVFDKFIQISRKDGPGIKGTGLGLGIAKGLVELHNGSIKVTSVINKGSTFIFTIPILDKPGIIQELIEDHILEANNKETPFSIMILTLINIEKNVIKKHSLNQDTIFHTIKEIMEHCLRRNADRIFRLSDTESIILLPETDQKGAVALRQRFEAKVRSYLDTFETVYRIQLSIKLGFAGFPVNADTGKGLIALARNTLKELYIGDERRKTKRLPVDILIKGINDKGEYVEFQTINISTGGVCISTPRYIEIPEHNNITIYLPRDYGTINVKAKVSWTKNNESLDEYQIGLKFHELSGADTLVLERFIEFHKDITYYP